MNVLNTVSYITKALNGKLEKAESDDFKFKISMNNGHELDNYLIVTFNDKTGELSFVANDIQGTDAMPTVNFYHEGYIQEKDPVYDLFFFDTSQKILLDLGLSYLPKCFSYWDKIEERFNEYKLIESLMK